MSFHSMETLRLNTRDPAWSVPEHACWDAVEVVRQERARIFGEESSSYIEDALSGAYQEDPGDEENLLYSLWCELRQRPGHAADFGTDLSSLPISESESDKQIHERQWEDKAAVAPRRVGTRKIRIQERSHIYPVSSQEEFGVEEGEWEDTAAVKPKVKGVLKVRITGKKRLKPSTFPGEFDDEQ